MELFKASARGTASSASGVLVGASAAGTDESSSGRERAATASRQRRGGAEESVHVSSVSCLRARKTPGPRVLSRLLQLNAQRQHPSFPTTASAAAAVLLAFAAAPIRAGPVPAAGLPKPASGSASPSPPASPSGETRSPRAAAVASRSVSPASAVKGVSPSAAAAARFAAAAAALASDSAVEPGLGRPFTIEEETQQQLLEEEGGVAAPATSGLGDAAAAADSRATETAALRAGQHACGRMLCRTLASQRGEDSTYGDGDGAATVWAATAAGQPKAAVPGEGARGGCHSEAAGEAQSAKAAEPRDNEATSEHASSSAEFVESCVVPWKPTCLTEISFDYSVSSTKGDGAAASLSPYESQRSTTSEPAENCPADRAGGSLTTASANALCSSLWNRWPSGTVEPAQCGAVSVRCASAVRTPHRRQGSITSDSDCAATAAATEGMPSNVSRWRLGRATPLRQQKQHGEQPEMMLQQQQVSRLRLQQQRSSGHDGGHELPLQQQIEAALKQHEQEKDQNVLHQQRGQHGVRRPLEQHLKKQRELQDKQPGAHDKQPVKTQTLLQAEYTGDLLVQRRKQRKLEERLQQQQLEQPQHEQPPQSHQQQRQTQEPVQCEQFQEAEDFFNLVVKQLHQQQQAGKQPREFSGEQQRHSHEQKGLQQHQSGKTGVFFQKHQLPLQDQDEEGVRLQQQQQQPPGCAEMRYEASSTVAVPAARTRAAPGSNEARTAATARGAHTTGAVAPAAVSPPEAARVLPTAVAAGGILAAAAAAAALATEEGPEKDVATASRQRYVQSRPPRRKRKNRGGCFVQTSSSGYPGVSWNRRMGAWLAFFYDTQSRRSRTFHPKYFNGDIEATRIAAIEFKKSVDRLFSCAPKTEEQPYTVCLQRQHDQDKEQEEQPRVEDQGEQTQEEKEQHEHPTEGEEQQEEPSEREEQKENPQQQHLLHPDLNRPPQQVSGWTASLLPFQELESQPVEEREHEEQRKHGGLGGEDKETHGSSSSRPLRVPQDVSVGEGDGSLEAATTGRKRGRQDDVEETGGAANVGCVVSPCLAPPRLISVTDLASALLPPAIALNEVGALRRDAGASCSNDTAAREEPSATAVAPVAGAGTVHEEAADATARSVPVRSDTDRTSSTPAPLQAPLFGATLTATAASSPAGVDLSVLAAMGSQERLQKVLTFETDLPGTSAHRLAFSWSRLSTLSTENLNGFYRSGRSSLQLLAHGPGAACPTAGGAGGTATEEAGREGCRAAALTIHQLLRRAQSEEEEKEDEHNFNMPSLLQQLQLNEGAAAASISSSEVHLDYSLLREGEEELHRILERSYGLLPFPFLWRRELHFSDSKEACPEGTTRSRLHDANSSTSRKDTSACSSSSSGTDSITDRAGRSSSKDGGTSSGDRSNSTHGTSCRMSGVATNGSSSNIGTESNPV